jgi:hypothetical protein
MKGNVKPALYGVSTVVSSIPLIGRIFIGDKKKLGIISAPYKIKESY